MSLRGEWGRWAGAAVWIMALSSIGVVAQGWPQWRGPTRDANVSASFTWPQRLVRKWSVHVGEGMSSPVVSDKRIFVFSRQDERETLRAISADTGAEHWITAYNINYVSLPEASRVGAGPRATPVVARDRVYTFGATGVLSSYDARTGQLRWRKDTSAEFQNTALRYGASTSPLVERDLLIVHIGHEQVGALAAHDAMTGEAKWRSNNCPATYSSPVVAEFSAVRQIVVVCYRSIAGIAVDTGRVLWEHAYEGLKYPHSVTPLVYGDTVIMSGWGKGLNAFRVTRNGEGWRAERAWHNDAISISLSSPVIAGDFLFALSDRNSGQFVCVDARTGTLSWASQGREGEMASIVRAAKHILFLKDDGELVVADADPQRLNIVARYRIADAFSWTTPAVVPGQIFVRYGDELARWEVPSS